MILCLLASSASVRQSLLDLLIMTFYLTLLNVCTFFLNQKLINITFVGSDALIFTKEDKYLWLTLN